MPRLPIIGSVCINLVHSASFVISIFFYCYLYIDNRTCLLKNWFPNTKFYSCKSGFKSRQTLNTMRDLYWQPKQLLHLYVINFIITVSVILISFLVIYKLHLLNSLKLLLSKLLSCYTTL